jgi:hypothetical protein
VRVKQSQTTGKIEIVYDENLPSPDLLAGCMIGFAEPVAAPARNAYDAATRRWGNRPGKARVARDDGYYRV